jgi:hypothetical protein
VVLLTARLNSLRKKSGAVEKSFPQGLKPNVFATAYGTAEAMPFQNRAFFRSLRSRALIQASGLSVSGEIVFFANGCSRG